MLINNIQTWAFCFMFIVNATSTLIVEQAETLYNARQYQLAESILRELLVSDPNNGDARVALGVTLHSKGDVAGGLEQYEIAQSILGDQGFLLANIGRALWQLDRGRDAVQVLERVVNVVGEVSGEIVNHDHPSDDTVSQATASNLNSLGLSYHKVGDDAKAMEAYRKAEQLDARYNRGELMYNMAISLNQLGFAQDAVEYYNAALAINPNYAEALVNLAALYHEHLLLDEAIPLYNRVVNLDAKYVSETVREMAQTNMATAMIEQGNSENALEILLQLKEKIFYKSEHESRMLFLTTLIVLARRVICDWTEYYETLEWMVETVLSKQIDKNVTTSLLPFDTLLLPISMHVRKRIAISHANQYPVTQLASHRPLHVLDEHMRHKRSRLNIGYLSYDYTDHPTAHLVEALFVHHDSNIVSTYAFSYGKDDNSGFRKRIQNAADHFVQLESLSHRKAVERISSEEIHILMDMQGFTRGGRPQICQERPAPVIVNYLVFPGTSGSSFTDYFVGDRYITPAELATSMTERLVIMPHSYQVNFYMVHNNVGDVTITTSQLLSNPSEYCQSRQHICDSLLVSAKSRRTQQKPAELVVFCNFNKNDKLDPETFAIWMEILQKVPNSVLWLLEPSRSSAGKALKMNLQLAAKKLGVDPAERLLFAPRVSKQIHLERHKFADVFLDSLVYGAHSTATDALYGNLPVLTVRGQSIPNKVATSLLLNLGDPVLEHLAVEDKKAFVQVAQYLVTYPYHALDLINQHLESVTNVPKQAENPQWQDETAPLFRSDQYTSSLEHGFRVMWELVLLGMEPQHIILS